MLPGHIPLDAKIKGLSSAILTRQVGLAGFCVLIWDHAITLDEEICLIWRHIPDLGRKDYRRLAFTILFLLNRYIVPISFLINIVAYFSAFWTTEVRSSKPCPSRSPNLCSRRAFVPMCAGARSHRDVGFSCSNFVVYEGILTMTGIAIADLIMLSRVEALWRTSKYYWHAVGGLSALWTVFIILNSWLLTHTGPVYTHVDPSFTSCTMVFDPQYDHIAPASAWLPLLYDTTVIVLTLIRTWPMARNGVLSTNAYDIGRELIREGLLYYGIIFAVTFSLTLMIAFAPPGIQNICAQLELCLTAAMMSRITLTLKRRCGGPGELPYEPTHPEPILSDLRVITHPPRVVQGRGRIQYIERAQTTTSMFAVVSHVAGEEGAVMSVSQVDVDGRDSDSSDSVEMVDMVAEKDDNKSPV
ncbi:unnamed protein product [Peniophora sp. CBMAI 1063]|nr:unnamed protein product [Peniophora sp. CBMAI 1063]